MSEELLWYGSRVSGLMTWILAVGALTAGLVAAAAPRHQTVAGQWASDSRDFLGRSAVVALAVHGATIVAADRFPLTASAVLTGQEQGQWLATGLLTGVIGGWAILVVELLRPVAGRLGPTADRIGLLISVWVVAAGAYHGWEVGSDTGNTFALVVVGICGLVLMGAAALGLTPFIANRYPAGERYPADADVPVADRGLQVDHGPGRHDRGPDSDIGTAPTTDGQSDRADDNAVGRVRPEAPLTVSLSRIANRPAPNLRGPEIHSARDVSIPGVTEQQPAEDEPGSRWSGESSWSVRKIPDAPKPQHRPPE